MADPVLDNPFKLTAVKQSVTEVPLTQVAPPIEDGATTREQKEIKRLRSVHPDYKENKDHWLFLLQSYEGGPQYVNEDNLFSHLRENDESYDDRKARAHYQNYCSALVDFVPEFIFSQPINRDPDPGIKPLFDKFVVNVDRAGTPLDAFMRTVAEDARIFGHCWIGIDKMPVPQGESPDNISVARAAQLGIDMPYFFAARPLEVLNWTTDQFGTYVYFKRVETIIEQAEFEQSKIERYTEWTRTAVRISRVDVSDPDKPTLIDQTTNPNKWGFIPFVPVFHKRSKFNKDMGVSFLQDIAYQNRAVFNYTSLIQEFLYRQCFNMLAMEADTALPTVDRQQGAVGQANVVEFPKGGTPPDYITPPADPAQFIQSERSEAVQEMYRQAAQDTMGELFGADARSGDAARQQFGRTVPVIAKLADYLQMTEEIALSMWARMMKKVWKGKVAYRDDYSVTSVMDLILELSSIFNDLKVLSPTFIREEWLRIIREFDGRIPADKMETIIAEIKKTKDDELLTLYKQPIPTRPGAPTTAQMKQGQNQQTMGSDKRRSMRSGDASATKEVVPDINKRTTASRNKRQTVR